MAVKYEGATPVPNAFIDRYMAVTNPLFVLVYLMGLRACLYNQAMTMADLAAALNILESDVKNAWAFWEKEGLVAIQDEGDGESIDFLPIPEIEKKPVQLAVVRNNAPEGVAPRPVMLDARPQYTVEELELYKNQSQNIERLFKSGEEALGKLLNYNDLNVLFGMYDWLRIPLDVIIKLLTYCAGNGHRSIRYMERVAVDWAENEINTVEKADAYISTFNTDYREILKAFGHIRREPTASEIKYMKKWRKEYGLPLPVVLAACDKTVMQIGQPKFSYADKILQSWRDKGINTLEAVEEADSDYGKNAEKPKRSVKEPVKKNRFVNYKQRDINYEQLEKQEQEYLQRIIN